MKKFISCGKFNKILLLIIIIYLVLSTTISALLKNIVYKNDKDDKNDSKDQIFFRFLMIYISLILFIIPEIILNKYIFKNKKEISESTKKQALVINYIFNDLSDRLTLKDNIFIFCVSILTILIDFITLILLISIHEKANEYFQNENYYLSELFFLFLFSILIYKMKFYKHQYFSIIVIIISGIIRFIITREYYVEFFDKGVEFFKILLGQLLVSFFESLIFVYNKGLMEYKYFSPYKVCYIFGIVNSLILLIIYIIISFIPCENKLCDIEYNGKKYIDNILGIFNNYDAVRFISLIFCSILHGCLRFLKIVTINNYTTCHLFLLFQTNEIGNTIIENIEQKLEGPYYFILFFTHILQFLLSLIFLEIIEINFFNLNENTKQNIEKRAIDDINLIEKEKDDSDEDSNEEDEKKE